MGSFPYQLQSYTNLKLGWVRLRLGWDVTIRNYITNQITPEVSETVPVGIKANLDCGRTRGMMKEMAENSTNRMVASNMSKRMKTSKLKPIKRQKGSKSSNNNGKFMGEFLADSSQPGIQKFFGKLSGKLDG